MISDDMAYLLEPLAYGFMQQAFLMALLSLVPAALLSCFVVLRRWSLMGDALSHAVLPGLVGAYILGLPMIIGAFAAGLITVFAAGFIKSRTPVKEDAVLGIVFSAMFGLGLMLFSAFGVHLHIERLLFGDLLGALWEDIQLSMVIGGMIVLIIVLKWRELMLFVFDDVQFVTLGLSEPFYRYGFLMLLSLSVVGALKAVGLLLTIAMLITPGVTALLLTRRFALMLVISVCVAVTSGFFGIYLSFFLNSSPAATIVLFQTSLFVIALLYRHINPFVSPEMKSLVKTAEY